MIASAKMPVASRLLRGAPGREGWDEYRRSLPIGSPEQTRLIETLAAADLRGRGGAGFPAALKWGAVADQGGVPVVIANGEEGEPASVKDRFLLRFRPHAVLDGLLIGQRTLGADRAIVYLAEEGAASSIEEARRERPDASDVEIVRVDHDYVAGEESAAVRAINGGPAMPTAKPPRPFEAGVEDRPTLVQNVETLACVAWLARHGANGLEVLAGGDSFLATIAGACAAPGLYELPYGESIGEAMRRAGADIDNCRGLLMGGYFGGVMNRRAFDLPLGYDDLRAAGTGLGCGAFMLLGPDHCPVATTAAVVRFFAGASSGQCGACVNGSDAMAAACERLRDGSPEGEDLENLERWALTLKGRGACGLIDGAAHQVASLFREFPEDVESHAAGEPCHRCRELDHEDWVRPDIDALLTPNDDWSKR